MKDDTSGLKQLGSNTTEYKYDEPSASILETFPNQFTDEYIIELTINEWSSRCPRTGQPDFGKITILYTPDKLCIESKSLKLYFFSWRNEGCFMETITNRIADDIYSVCEPKSCKVMGEFNSRGGVKINVFAIRNKKDAS